MRVPARQYTLIGLALLILGGGVQAAGPGHGGFPAVFVGNQMDDTLTIIDPLSDHEIGAVLLSGPPLKMAVSPDGEFLFVTHTVGDLIDIIRLDGMRLGGTLRIREMEGAPYGVGMNPDGRQLWIWATQGREIKILEHPRHEVVGRTPVDPEPLDVLFAPDRTGAYVVHAGSNRIAHIDPDSYDVKAWMEAPAAAQAATLWGAGGAEGFRLFIAHAEGLSVLDAVNGEVLHTVSFPGKVSDMVLNPGQTELWVVVQETATLLVVDTKTLEILASISTVEDPTRLVFTPGWFVDEFYIYTTHHDMHQISKIDPQTREVLYVLDAGWGPHGIVVNP